MSRYNDYPPRGPPTERWDNDRLARERPSRTTVIEKDRFEERDRFDDRDRYAAPLPTRRRESSADGHYGSRPRDRGGYEEDDRFYEREERYGPPARREPAVSARQVREQRRYYEEDDYEEEDDRGPRRFAGGRGGRNEPRPGMLVRRQSSLDTFDRKPMRHREPEVVSVPAPRGGRGGVERHRYEPRYAERDYEEMDIRIAEPDRYGDDGFRGWKEREVETIRRRGPEVREREEIREEVVIEEEKPWPRRGRTRMTAKLVNKRALVQLGYPYEDELTDEGDFVIILKALNKELIDEVLGLSKDFNARMTSAFAIEAPAPEREVIERREIVIGEPNEVPRSVRDWDVMSGSLGGGKSEHGGHGSVAASHKSHRSHKSSSKSVHRSRSKHRRHSSSSGSTVKKGGRSRSTSPVVVIRSKSRHRSHSSAGHKKEISRREIDLVEDEEVGESNDVAIGPLSLVVPHTKKRSNSKDERKIKEEIRELEDEKRRLKRERRERKHHHRDDDDDEVIIERVHSSHYRPKRDEGEIIIERDHHGRSHSSHYRPKRDEGEIIIERDHHGRSHSRKGSGGEIIIERGHHGRSHSRSHSRHHSDSDDDVLIERIHRGEHGGRKEEEIKIEKDRKGKTDSKLMKAMFATLT